MTKKNTQDDATKEYRRFHFVDEKSSKFWEICAAGDGFDVRYGKIGTTGQSQTKNFVDAATAIEKAERLIAEKVGKGYVEVSLTDDEPFGANASRAKALIASVAPVLKSKVSESVNLDELSTSEMVELASNPDSTSKQLAALVNRHLEVNRALAKHAKATPVLLRQIAEHWDDELDGCDVEAQRLIAQNPNTPVDLLVELGHQFPTELLRNPAVKTLMLKKPKFLDQFPGVRRLPECPESYLRSILESESDEAKLDMLRNPDLPLDFRQKLTPDYFYQRAMDSLQRFAGQQKNGEDRRYVEAYAGSSQSYCIPRFVPLDRNNRDHRLADQVIRGFPFTSSNWPWPRTEEGKPMQPLAQIDLEKAGTLLDIELGRGLLQVWSFETLKPLLRIVPVTALEEDLDSFYPGDALWNVECGDESEDVALFYLYLSQMLHPRIEWIRAGKMFPRPFQSMQYWCEENTKFNERKQEQLSERIENLLIPMMERGDDATKWVHLGGYPGGYGNEGARCHWSGTDKRLLLYVRDGVEEVVFTMQVMVAKGVDGTPSFEAYISCDR